MATETAAAKGETPSGMAAAQPAFGKPEEVLAFLSTYKAPASDPASLRRDVIADRFVLQLSEPLPTLNTHNAKAYAARDEKNPERELYALVCKAGTPYRTRAVTAMLHNKIPNMPELVATGIVELSATSESCFALVLDRPKGISLLQLMQERGKALPEVFIAEQIIKPAAELIKFFNEKGICHGHINLETLWFSDRLIVSAHCYTDTPGIGQPFLFEPVDRAMAAPIGRGEDTAACDIYALSVTVLHLLTGTYPLLQSDRDTFVGNALNNGGYNTLTQGREFSEYMSDFLRGTLNDSRTERWDGKQILQWAEGKRFNLIAPSSPRDAPRPYEFEKVEYHNFRALAWGLYKEWDAARIQLRDSKIARWVELSAHKREIAELLNRTVRNTGGESSTSEKLGDELVARSIITLDPQSPIRYKTIATTLDGLGAVIADALLNKRQMELQYLTDIILEDMISYWSDLQKDSGGIDVSTVLWKVQKIRIYLRSGAYGFGMERAMYDLCPTLPCQSPLLVKHSVSDLTRLLQVLDQLAPQLAKDNSFMDRHIAAFIASKADIPKEVRITEMANTPALAGHKDLINLKLLRLAQDKVGTLKLPGLCHWVATRLFSAIGEMHNRKLREKLAGDMKKVAKNGSLEQLYACLINAEVAASDQAGFEKATAMYRSLEQQVETLRDTEQARKEALDLALKISLGGAYLLCIISLYYFAVQVSPVLLH